MATLVLTTVGTAIGGPIGGALGALLGGQVDRRLLAGKGRQGPRLGDLRVQTSSYGTPIPKLFGRLRVAGTVIWATDLREEGHSSGGGKAGPKSTTYSYSASFAVALSGRAIAGVERIWADGKLLRGSAGDWKSQTGFRLYLGDEDQPVDPLIAAAEGIASCPAFRGIAYAVFEGMALAEFGNRIPSLTFEVVADAAPVAIGAIAARLCDAVAGDAGPALAGFAAQGDSVRTVLETLGEAFPLSLTDDGVWLRLDPPPEDAIALPEAALGAAVDGKPVARRQIEQGSAATLPDAVSIAYYEPARDWQAGVQQARRGPPGGAVRAIELPAALAAEEARGAAEAALARAWQERVRATVRLPHRWMGIAPGAVVTLPSDATRWRVAQATIERMVTELRLVRLGNASLAAAAASAGQAIAEADAPAGATQLALLDLPPLDGASEGMALWVAACGDAGWRRAALSLSIDGGTSWQAIGDTAMPATMGAADDALAPGDAALFDRVHSVTVTLAHEAMTLTGATEAALLGAANLAMLGDELIQFGQAQQIGARQWRLGTLLRGRRGTEAAMAGHAPGERFVLIEAAALRRVELPATPPLPVLLSARGVGDADAVTVAATATARALRPPSPVRLSARAEGGGVRFAWVRRSRIGWSWIDGADAPLGEERELYRVTIIGEGAAPQRFEVAEPWLALAEPPLAPITIELCQLGAWGASAPATRRFTTEEMTG